MSITDEQIIKFEKENEDEIYGALMNFISLQREQNEHVQKFGQFLGIDENIPNIGITCNNKLAQISQLFREKDLSMFVDVIEDGEKDFINSNVVGDAIINDIVNKLYLGGKAISRYHDGLREILTSISEKKQALTNLSPMKKFLYKVRDILGIKEEPLYSKQDVEKVKPKLEEYINLDKQIFEYNLEENLTDSIIEYLKSDVYSDSIKPLIVEDIVIPILEDLDLEKLVPEIEERFETEVLKKGNLEEKKSWELSEEQKQDMQEKSGQIVKDSNKGNIKQEDSNDERI